MVKKLHTVGKSKCIILDKAILRLLNIEDEKNDRLEINVYGNQIVINKYEEESNTNKKVG